MKIKTETTIVYWGYIGVIEHEMETTIGCSAISRLQETRLFRD